MRPYLRSLTGDPAYLNLLGVIHEVRGKRHVAMELYRVALITDPDFGPARLNLHRLESGDLLAGTARLSATLGDVQLRIGRTILPASN